MKNKDWMKELADIMQVGSPVKVEKWKIYERTVDFISSEIEKAEERGFKSGQIETYKEVRESIVGEYKLQIEIWKEFIAEKLEDLTSKEE